MQLLKANVLSAGSVEPQETFQNLAPGRIQHQLSKPATPEEAVGVEKFGQMPSSSSEWTNVVKGRKQLSLQPSRVSHQRSTFHPINRRKNSQRSSKSSSSTTTSQKKDHLRPLFKCTSIDLQSTEIPRNFPNAPRVTVLVRNTGGNPNVWDYLVGAKNVLDGPDQASRTERKKKKKIWQRCAQGGSRCCSTHLCTGH